MLFLRPAASIPHTEKIRATYACKAGAVIRSRAIIIIITSFALK